MTIAEITERNYNAAVRRAKIHPQMNEHAFHKALQSEVDEFYDTLGGRINPFDVSELADVVLVAFSMAKHFGYDMQKELENKTLYNEVRTD